ncbi:MAG: hypothetical protein NOI47_000050 [Candidatus Phytoplasma pruni]|nr:hypothetical protein [Candidatus Phytoplasma pruni]
MLYYYKKLKNYFLFIICLFLLFVSLIKVKASPNYIDEIYKQRRIIEENKVKNEETNKESVKKEEIVVKQESFIDEIYRKQRKDCEIETSKLQEIFDYLPCLDIVLEQNKDKYEESEIRKEFNRLYKEINKNSLNQENAIETIYKQLRKKFEKKENNILKPIDKQQRKKFEKKEKNNLKPIQIDFKHNYGLKKNNYPLEKYSIDETKNTAKRELNDLKRSQMFSHFLSQTNQQFIIELYNITFDEEMDFKTIQTTLTDDAFKYLTSKREEMRQIISEIIREVKTQNNLTDDVLDNDFITIFGQKSLESLQPLKISISLEEYIDINKNATIMRSNIIEKQLKKQFNENIKLFLENYHKQLQNLFNIKKLCIEVGFLNSLVEDGTNTSYKTNWAEFKNKFDKIIKNKYYEIDNKINKIDKTYKEQMEFLDSDLNRKKQEIERKYELNPSYFYSKTKDEELEILNKNIDSEKEKIKDIYSDFTQLLVYTKERLNYINNFFQNQIEIKPLKKDFMSFVEDYLKNISKLKQKHDSLYDEFSKYKKNEENKKEEWKKTIERISSDQENEYNQEWRNRINQLPDEEQENIEKEKYEKIIKHISERSTTKLNDFIQQVDSTFNKFIDKKGKILKQNEKKADTLKIRNGNFIKDYITTDDADKVVIKENEKNISKDKDKTVQELNSELKYLNKNKFNDKKLYRLKLNNEYKKDFEKLINNEKTYLNNDVIQICEEADKIEQKLIKDDSQKSQLEQFSNNISLIVSGNKNNMIDIFEKINKSNYNFKNIIKELQQKINEINKHEKDLSKFNFQTQPSLTNKNIKSIEILYDLIKLLNNASNNINIVDDVTNVIKQIKEKLIKEYEDVFKTYDDQIQKSLTENNERLTSIKTNLSISPFINEDNSQNMNDYFQHYIEKIQTSLDSELNNTNIDNARVTNEKLVKKIEEIQNDLKKQYNDVHDNLNEQIGILKGQIEQIKIDLEEKLNSVFQQIKEKKDTFEYIKYEIINQSKKLEEKLEEKLEKEIMSNVQKNIEENIQKLYKEDSWSSLTYPFVQINSYDNIPKRITAIHESGHTLTFLYHLKTCPQNEEETEENIKNKIKDFIEKVTIKPDSDEGYEGCFFHFPYGDNISNIQVNLAGLVAECFIENHSIKDKTEFYSDFNHARVNLESIIEKQSDNQQFRKHIAEVEKIIFQNRNVLIHLCNELLEKETLSSEKDLDFFTTLYTNIK